MEEFSNSINNNNKINFLNTDSDHNNKSDSNESNETFLDNQSNDLIADNIENLSGLSNLDSDKKLPIDNDNKSAELVEFKNLGINENNLDGQKLINKLSHSNLVQSSVPLINKSRNLFNFITEKSTNIMEKALLPQYLQHKEFNQRQENEIGDFSRQVGDNSLEIKENAEEIEEMSYEMLMEEFRKVSNDKLMLVERIKELENKNLESKEPESPSIDNREATITRLTSELRTAMFQKDSLLQQYTSANKERESMVMKYASSEKQRLDLQRNLDQSHARLKQLAAEKETVTSNLKAAFSERSRVAHQLESKCRELEKAIQRISELNLECENVRRDATESIRKFQQSEDNKAVTLDQQLKEQHAKLIVEESERQKLLKEIEVLNHRQQVLVKENNTLVLKVGDLEAVNLELRNNLEDLKVKSEEQLKKIKDLTTKSEDLESIRVELLSKNQELSAIDCELQRLQLVNKEMENDMNCCVQRENQMLEFTQKLTDKNVRLQSDFTLMESKLQKLEQQEVPLRDQAKELKAKIKEMAEELKEEKKKRINECEILARHLAEQTKMAENLKQMLEDSKGENLVLKRKHQMTIKELTREVGQLKKKLEGSEVVETRTPSVLSLNEEDKEVGMIYNELDKQALIDRVIKLQRTNVKRAEKLDFLEEHTRVLVAELQKKTKIIQNYILSESFDAMGSYERDKYKAELIKHGGIMASVYHQRVSDDNMTLELSLEINQKLQTVLEDALLKNITLKDNIDTLGDEIAKLTIQNQKAK